MEVQQVYRALEGIMILTSINTAVLLVLAGGFMFKWWGQIREKDALCRLRHKFAESHREGAIETLPAVLMKEGLEIKVAEPDSWFRVASPEDLVRKVHAGVALLQKESTSSFWTARQRENYEKAAAYVQAAEDMVRRGLATT